MRPYFSTTQLAVASASTIGDRHQGFRGQVIRERLEVDVLVFRFNSLDCGCFKQAADSDHHPLRKHQNPLSDFAIVGKVAAGWQGRRDPRSPAKAGLKGVHCQDCRRHAAHHLPLYQDKAVTPTSLKDIFTPIWSGPPVYELIENDT